MSDHNSLRFLPGPVDTQTRNNLATNPLSELAKLALGATKNEPATDLLVRAMELVRNQTGAIAALVFYADQSGRLAGSGMGDNPKRYSEEVLTYLQQRLVQLRVPLAFNIEDGQATSLTRASNKQRRDYIAWLVPVADSWTELLVLRGSWPPETNERLLDAVQSGMPALTILLERFVGTGSKQRLERQLDVVNQAVQKISPSSELVGSVVAVAAANRELPEEQLHQLRELSATASDTLAELRANRDVIQAHLRLQEYTSRLEHAIEIEREKATTDALTGLLNHRGGLQTLEGALEGAASPKAALSLLIGDIDSFKLFNDTYGHVAGDEVLKLAAIQCQASVGEAGTVCRNGGDEFLIILPGADSAEAIRMAADITERFGNIAFRTEAGETVPVRMSIGVASYPEHTASPSKLIAIADAAMYEAKHRPPDSPAAPISSGAETTFGVLESLVLAVDTKDRYTRDHCDIVAEYAAKLAQRLELSEESVRALRVAGLLHDIGKVAVPDEILKKPAPLTQDEYEVMQRHVKIGEVLIREVPQLKDVIQAVSCHHERYDGSGYPRGLAGNSIPLLGRIIAVADAYSAMALDRPYRKAMPRDAVIAELVAGSGIQFDPEISRVFVELLIAEQLQERTAA